MKAAAKRVVTQEEREATALRSRGDKFAVGSPRFPSHCAAVGEATKGCARPFHGMKVRAELSFGT